MIRSRVFVVLAIALFLACFVCAEAAEDENSKDKAEKDVKALQDLTKKVLAKAETKFNDAESVKSTVEEQKDKAVRAEADVRKAAAKITAENRKAEAEVVAEKAQSELENCNTLYQDAKVKAETASNSLREFLTKARDLKNSAQKDIPAALSPPENYAQVIKNAKTATSEATALNKQIVASTLLSTANFALWKLREGAKKVQVSKYQAESIVTVSNIEAKMSEAQNDIQSIQQKRGEIDTIVDEMNTKLQSAPDSLKGLLSSLCTNAGGFLRTATNKVAESNKCNEDMQGRKTLLDEDLKTLMATIEEGKAKTEAGRVEWHANYIDAEFAKIKEALRAAGNAFNSAKNQQQQMLRELTQKNRQSGSEVNKLKTNDKVTTEEVINTIRNAEENEPVITSAEKPTVVKTDEPDISETDKPEITETEKPTGTKTDGPEITDTEKPQITEADKPEITETEKPIFGKSEDTMDKTSDQPVDANFDKTKQNKSTQLTHEGKQNPKDGNSELLNNDKLRKITKDITNNPLIGGELPTRSAANDSAVTVFIPLLVTLVMSAVLH